MRQIDPEVIEDALSKPDHRFYDALRGSEVAAKIVKTKDEVFELVVLYTKREDEFYVITVYPSKRFEEEADRKVKSGRWVVTKERS